MVLCNFVAIINMSLVLDILGLGNKIAKVPLQYGMTIPFLESRNTKTALPLVYVAGK